ncbi:unnamed protein product, partial [Prorocentrum cordatum]
VACPDGDGDWPAAARCAVVGPSAPGAALAAGAGAPGAGLVLAILHADELPLGAGLRGLLGALPRPSQVVLASAAWGPAARELAGEVLCDALFVRLGARPGAPAARGAGGGAALPAGRAAVPAPGCQGGEGAFPPPSSPGAAAQLALAGGGPLPRAQGASEGRPRGMPVFDEAQRRWVFEVREAGGGRGRFQTTVRAAGGCAERAGQVADLCWQGYQQGMSRAELLALRASLYEDRSSAG